MKKLIVILLNLCLAVVLVDAVVSLLDDSLILFFGINVLAPIRGMVFLLAVGMALLTYGLMGLTPMVPKRFFLPLTLFVPVMLLGSIPLVIYHYDRLPQIAWLISLSQVCLGLCVLFWIQGGIKLRSPLVREDQLGKKNFGWLNLFGFILINVFVALPGVILYLGFCAALAVDHFTGSFVVLRSDSVVMRARNYVRADGKAIHLIPMMHIGESDFYQQISKTFPSNSVILIEGVTDEQNLLKRKLTYKRVASSLGLAEQQEKFEPTRGRPRHADVDIGQFSASTIEFLNLVTALYSGGFNQQVLLDLVERSRDPRLAEQLWADLLTKRNEHLVKEIMATLSHSDVIVVPWGAAHMRGIAEEIQKSEFRPTESQEYTAIHFRTLWNRLTQGPRRSQTDQPSRSLPADAREP